MTGNAADAYERLCALDRAHLLHSLHHPTDHAEPLIFVHGEGAILTDVRGRQYIDGLSGLWNVTLGHGRRELAEAATRQMTDLAFTSAYAGASNVPAIELAARLATLAPGGLRTTFFTTGGGESNDSAFKTARYYWYRLGKPHKVKFISRRFAYHGVTMGSMSATGLPSYWTGFEPRTPGFSQIIAPYQYRSAGDAAHALEHEILQQGPENVAAFIAEPVQGAGGIIVPPDDYFPRVREICTRYEVLLIADEVITGFGRTGQWFGVNHWQVAPDILTFAKGITSGYQPLGGMMVNEQIHAVIENAPPTEKWMHAYTYSAHPVCCAVGLATLDILQRERLIERAARLGDLFRQLKTLLKLDAVGDVRGMGLMQAVELVADRETKEPFAPEQNVGGRVLREAITRGLFTRVRGDVILLAPPFVTTEAQIGQIVAILREAILAATGRPA
jgi:adenosylmethionine-8-amino-7-oxononanoate aminotransferase